MVLKGCVQIRVIPPSLIHALDVQSEAEYVKSATLTKDMI